MKKMNLEFKRKHLKKKDKLRHCGCPTDLVVELRKLHLDFIPLEIVILRLLTHWWDQVELACHRVRLLVPKQTETKRHGDLSALVPQQKS